MGQHSAQVKPVRGRDNTISEANNGAGVAQSVQCLTTDWTTGRSRFDPRQRRKDFSSSFCVHTGSVVHPASCTVDTGGSFPGGKAWPKRDADHSTPSSAESMNEYELYLLLLQAPPWRVAGLLYFLLRKRTNRRVQEIMTAVDLQKK
jgi:hypothetical protein